MRLIPISEREDAAQILWDLLEERPAEANISHRKMPTRKEHEAYIAYHDPRSEAHGFDSFEDWCFLEEAHGIVGAIYLTKKNEIGISIFNEHQGRGHARNAIATLMQKHGERNYYANVSPRNEGSKRLWERLGFRLLQETYALEPA